VDAGVKSDLRNAAVLMETAFTDTQSYPVATDVAHPITSTLPDLKVSPGDVIKIVSSSSSGYCLSGTNPNATGSDASPSTPATLYYSSTAGGLLKPGVTCS
jgi:hypothetical protein